MGKYMRKGKGAGKVVVMEVSQGSLGVRTRAKTLALEQQDRKLSSARNASLKQQQDETSRVDPFQTSYLELRSRKLEKDVNSETRERPDRGPLVRQDGLSEDVRNLSEAEEAPTSNERECTTRPATVVDWRTAREDNLHVEVVVSSQTPELSPRQDDGFDVLRAFARGSACSTPRKTLDDAHLRCNETGLAEEPLRLGAVHVHADGCGGVLARKADDGEWPLIVSYHSQGGPNSQRPKVQASCGYATSEPGNSATKRQYFHGSPVSTSSRDREAAVDESSGPSIRIVDDGQDLRAANHLRISNRRYMSTNLFVDAEAIDELFAASDAAEREEGKRFTERYNFDVVNDLPLKGRYEWVVVDKPCCTITTTQHQPDPQKPS